MVPGKHGGSMFDTGQVIPPGAKSSRALAQRRPGAGLQLGRLELVGLFERRPEPRRKVVQHDVVPAVFDQIAHH